MLIGNFPRPTADELIDWLRTKHVGVVSIEEDAPEGVRRQWMAGFKKHRAMILDDGKKKTIAEVYGIIRALGLDPNEFRSHVYPGTGFDEPLLQIFADEDDESEE